MTVLFDRPFKKYDLITDKCLSYALID